MDDLKKAINEVKQAAQTAGDGTGQGAPQGPVKIRLGDQEFAFNSPEELGTAMTNVIAGYQSQIAELQKKAVEAAQAAAAAAAAGQQVDPKGSYVTEDEPPPFSKEKYVELLRNDPIAAAEYIDNYRLFGGLIERPADLLRTVLARVAEQDRILAAYAFRSAHPEFPGGNEAVSVLETIRQENNLPFTAAGLEAAYGIAQARGLLPGPQQYQQFVQQQQAQMAEQWKSYITKDLRPQGPPSLGRSATEVPPDIAEMAESLTPEQIEEIFNKLQTAKG